MRDPEFIRCKCGGLVDEVEVTKEENKSHDGCSKVGCCVKKFECRACGTYFVFRLEAPDADVTFS